MAHRVPRLVPWCLATAMVLAACGTDEPGTVLPDGASPSATPSPSAEPSPSPSPDEDPSPEPSPSPSPVELAGEPFDGPPLNGMPATMLVLGVAADDVLNVRSGPGTDADVVATLAPLATDVAATGAARLLPGSIWLEVEHADGTGWANSSFFAFPGPTDDITARLLEAAGERPSAPTLEELAIDVAALVASEDPPSRIVISDGPDVGDLGEVTVDVVGLGDDAVVGLRLVVFATEEGDGFSLRTVEATDLCGRGVGLEDGCP